MKKVFLLLTMFLFAFTGVTRANVQQNRDDQVIEQGFEDGLGDWTTNHCHSSSGVTSSYGGNTGNYAFRFYYTTNYPQYLISPELDDNDGVNFTFYAARYSSNYPETFKVGYSSTTNEPTEFTWSSEVTCTTLYGAGAYQEYSYDFPAGTKYVSIACTSNYQFYMFVDDITVTATEPAPTPGGALTTTPDVLDLGYRPNGAWMAPYVFTINGTGTTVNALDFSGNYFTYNAELPATLTAAHPLEVELTTGEAEEGAVNSTMTVLFSGNRDAQQFNVTANAYNPVNGDVYEKATVVSSFPYNATAPASIYKNYALPTETEGADAVYKMTFANDVMLTAGTTGADGVAALYTEDFNGEGGPMEDNNYEYNGPTINPGPVSMWFSYAYTGSNTWYGTSAGGGYYFGYKISTDVIAAENLAGLTITTVEAAAREAYPYHCFIIEGGADPFEGNMIGMGTIENPTALYFFDINLSIPAYITGNADIWVIFYSDSPYAAYCGRYPVNTANGKIWTYNPNATTPQWTSNTTYTPVIYCHMLELPTGRTATMDLAKMEVKKGNGVVSEVAEAEGNVMNVAKAQIANNNSRDVIDNNIEDLYVKAGTYYLAVASTDAEFPVSIATAEVPAPEQAIVYAPMDGETNVEYPYLAEWMLGDYTEEMQVLLGTQYPPQTALIDWTDYLVESAFLPELEPNQSYFMQVNERNAAGTTMGEIIAFTTPINAVDEVIVTNPALYPGDAAMLTWTAPERSFKGYNIYQDGVKINESLVTTTEYAVEDLPYNMDGYLFQVSAVYDAGESLLSAPDTAYMTGFGSVNGYVYDTDTLHPIANATMVVVGIDEYGAIQQYEFLTDETGFYEGEVLAGLYDVGILTEGYETAATVIYVAYDQLTGVEDIITHEFYYPLGQITATEEESDVLVEWSWDPAEMIVDFETGDFSQAEFTLPAQYPWAITTTNPYEGTYCMKSTCEGQASATSYIEATVEVPFAEAKMGFYVRVSSETNYDKFHFYIDGVEKGSALSGELPYAYKEFSVTGGTHTYKWEYAKDGSVNANDDCIYVDNITMFRKVEPTPPPAPGDVTVILTAPDVWGDGSGYQMLLDETHSLYGTIIPETGALSMNCSGNEGIYDQFSHKIPTNADGNCSTQNMVNNASVTITIPSGIYDWCITNPTPGDRIWIAASNGNVGGRQDDYVFEAGNTYEFVVSRYGNNDGVDVTITGGAKNTANASESDNAYANIDCKVADPAMLANRVEAPIKKIDMRSELNSRSIDLNGGNREFVSYNLYRRNNIDEESVENPTLLAQGIAGDVYEYLDTEWPALPYGEWQWGIAATYEGYAPVPNRETATFGFEGGSLDGWTCIKVNADGGEWLNSDDNPGGYDYTDAAHTGTGFAMCYSFIDYDGAYDTDAYLVSPQKYSIDANSSIAFWADNGNDTYPENFSVCVSTAANPTAADFTQIWSGGAKGTGSNGATVRRAENRYQNWRSHEISLADYAGQEIWIAFHDVNYDAYEIWIDDVTITHAGSAPVPPTPGPTGDGISEILWSNVIDKDMIATLTVNVALNNGQSPAGAVVELEAADREYEFTIDETGTITEEIRKGEYLVEIELDGYTDIIDLLVADEDEISLTYVLQEVITPVEGLYVSPTGWAMWDGGSVGPTPGPTGDDSFEESFEGGLNGWNVLTVNTDGGEWLHSSQNLGGHDYTGLAHTGTGFAMCYSFVDYVGAFNTDSYMYTPQKYDIVNGSTLTFFADNANDTYPENFSVVIATVDNPTAADFTQIWNGGAKGTGSDGAIVRHNDTRYENWRQHTIDLSAYAGQSVYIGFHDVNYDMYEIWIDDVTLSTGAKADRAALSYKVMLDGEYIGETYLPFVQLPVEGMEEGSEHVASIAPLYASGMGEWMSYTFTYTSCDNFAGTTSFNATANNADVTLTWTLPDGPTPPTPPTPGEGQWYQYGSDVVATGVGASGAFYWGVMFPAGSYQGNVVTKAATYEMSGYPFSGNVTIYNDGTAAPATAVGTMPVSVAGTADQWAEFEFAQPVSIDPTKNLWIIFYNETSTSYPAAACVDAGDPNARWVSLDGSSWMDLAAAGLSGYSWIIKAYVATSNKGEVTEITAPMGVGSEGPLASDGIVREYNNNFVNAGVGFGPSATNMTRDWNYYDTGNNDDAIGLTSGGGFYWGIMFPANTYEGTVVSKIAYFDYTAHTGSFMIYNGGDAAPGTLLYTQAYSVSGTSQYIEIELDEAVTIDNAQNLWLVMHNNNGQYVAAIDETSYGVANASCISTDGSTWYNTISAATSGSIDGNWNLRIYTEEGGPAPVEGILGVVLYRNDEFVGMFDANTTSYVDEGLESGHYDYTIRVIYGGEYDVTYYAMSCEQIETVTVGGAPSCDPVINPNGYYMNYQGQEGLVVDWTDPEGVTAIGLYEIDGGTPVFIGNAAPGQHPIFLGFEGQVPACTITIGFVAVYADCESEMVTCDIYYDAVDEQEVVNAIYPNPTSGDLHVNATAMTHVTVYNAMGQMVYDQEVSGDELILNMGQYEAGVYMVKVTTETGSSVKRINVVR